MSVPTTRARHRHTASASDPATAPRRRHATAPAPSSPDVDDDLDDARPTTTLLTSPLLTCPGSSARNHLDDDLDHDNNDGHGDHVVLEVPSASRSRRTSTDILHVHTIVAHHPDGTSGGGGIAHSVSAPAGAMADMVNAALRSMTAPKSVASVYPTSDKSMTERRSSLTNGAEIPLQLLVPGPRSRHSTSDGLAATAVQLGLRRSLADDDDDDVSPLDGARAGLLGENHSDMPVGKPTYISAFWTEQRLPTYRIDQVPTYLQDNEYIHRGYRAAYSMRDAWRSMLYIHNETGNIWTHLLGLVGFLLLVFATDHLVPPAADVWDRVVFVVFLLSACKCFLFSTLFHTHYCNSRQAYIRFGCLDYAGISLLICGSALVLTYYVFYCERFLRTVYVVSLLAISLVGIIGPLFSVWTTARFRVWRTLIYITSGLVAGLPVFHFLMVHGVPHDAPWWATYGWLVMGATYIAGAAVYAAKIPERWFPGKVDLVGHSHQIWHVLVVAAAVVHTVSAMEIMAWRIESGCPAPAAA
ncbi:Adiponectin receptor protein 1 [Allomyces arbusculus]|nr:Adiponectin receptor protein 1 [Allomyces arbusculus]